MNDFKHVVLIVMTFFGASVAAAVIILVVAFVALLLGCMHALAWTGFVLYSICAPLFRRIGF
ncbi:MAG: hypothetical protein Q7R88_02455 [bacterium]|nr:hypothetical protein [bacterium]